jgi:metacaspase-1
MSRGLSLHIGLNTVDPAHYDGWDGRLYACEYDANDMEALANERGFETTKLLTTEATSDAVVSAIDAAAGELESGDLLFVTYSGHGGQVPDRNREEEPDRSDETWLLYDRELVDDELYALWAKFRPGVRIVVLSDSCHSGTVLKNYDDPDVPRALATREAAAEQSPRIRAMPLDVMVETYVAHQELYDDIQSKLPTAQKQDIPASALLISGCQDEQVSLDGFRNGFFTENLLAVWDGGAWEGGGYRSFHQAILSRMPDTQRPNYLVIGAPNDAFEEQDPFTVG